MITSLRKFVLVLLMILGASCGSTDDLPVDNDPPELQLDVQPDLEWTAGDGIIRITATASDPDGDPVRIEMAQAPERSEFNSQGSWGVFTWDPLPSDVTPADQPPTRVVFAAIDEHDERTERVVSITVLASNGIPRFTNESSILHNAESDSPVSFDVVVRDDDSRSVAIRMPEAFAPEGAEFTRTGDLSGRFGWAPTAEQLAQRVHSVKFIADDGDHDPIEQNVTIIIRKSNATDSNPDDPNDASCRFETFVEYEPLGAQRGVENYEVRARLTGAGAQHFQKIVLNFTDGDGFNDRDLEWTSVDMKPDGEDFVGTIPNPLLEDAESIEYYWELCAIDSENQGDQPILCGPSSLYESFAAYAPESSECLDTWANGSEFSSSEDLTDDWAYGRLCAEAEDYWELGIGTEQEARFFVVYPRGKTPKIEVFDEDQNLLFEPEARECTGLTEFSIENTEEPVRRFVRVSGGEPDTTYQIVADLYDLTDDAACVDADLEPNDTVANAVAVEESTTFEDLEICRPNDVDIYAVDLEVGDRVTATAAFSHAVGDIDMVFFTPSQQEQVSRNGGAERYAYGVGDEETISHTATEAGTHWFVVYTVDNANRYSMEFNIEDEAVACVDNDPFEPNDTQSTAAFTSTQRHENLMICGGGFDWYKFFVIDWTSESFDISLEPGPDATAQSFTLEVWNTFGPLTTATESDGKLSTVFFAADNNDHYLRVTSSEDATYSLEIEVNFQF